MRNYRTSVDKLSQISYYMNWNINQFNVTASTSDGEIMAVKHREFPIYGVQFHPESIMTPEGKQMLRNFCR